MTHAPRATIEEWCPTHHPNYDVSNLGRVRSRARGKLRILRPGIASNGYPTVSFGRQLGSQCVHVLVAHAFLGGCPSGCEVMHKDDNRANPVASNLEYGTRADNVTAMMSRNRGRYVLVPQQVRNIRQLIANGITQRALAKTYGVNRETIGRIIRGKSWRHVV